MAPCFAPGCTSGHGNNKKSVHTFRPSHGTATEWVKILSKIRADKTFDPKNGNHRLCHLHFEQSLIIKEDIHIINGEKKPITRDKWKLVEGARPTIFPNLPAYMQVHLPRKRKPLAELQKKGLVKRTKQSTVSEGTAGDENGKTSSAVPSFEAMAWWIKDKCCNWETKIQNDFIYVYQLRFGSSVSVVRELKVSKQLLRTNFYSNLSLFIFYYIFNFRYFKMGNLKLNLKISPFPVI